MSYLVKALLAQCRFHGVVFRREKDRVKLFYKSPEQLPEEFIASLKRHKKEICDLLDKELEGLDKHGDLH